MPAQEIITALRSSGLTVFDGYPETRSRPPYVVVRPLITEPGDLVLCGQASSWDARDTLYCVGASVSASSNLATKVMRILQGLRAGGSTLSCSLGYVGSRVESNYETQVTTQVDQGAL